MRRNHFLALAMVAVPSCLLLFPNESVGQVDKEFGFDGRLESRPIRGITWPAPWRYMRASVLGDVNLSIERDPDQGGAKIAHLRAQDASFLILVDFRRSPLRIGPSQVLSWKWNATRLPRGGNVNNDRRNDQALQVYVSFKKANGYDVIGYIWDNNALGSDKDIVERTYRSRKYGVVNLVSIVIRRGNPNKWVDESRNLGVDYWKHFPKGEGAMVAVAIWCNSNSTSTLAEGYIGPLRFRGED